MNEDDIDPKDLDFSQYIPNWKGDSDREINNGDWSFEEGFETAIKDPETFIDEENEVKWKHVIKAAQLLKERNNGCTGPYSHEQVTETVLEVVLKEALDSLIEKNLLKQNPNGTYELTQNGISEAERMKLDTTEDDNKKD